MGSIGRPVGEVEVKIGVNDELLIKAKGCTPGYYNRPEKTAELWQDGWLHTGDKIEIDDDGFIFITGRVKDYFKTIQGKFVAPPRSKACSPRTPPPNSGACWVGVIPKP